MAQTLPATTAITDQPSRPRRRSPGCEPIELSDQRAARDELESSRGKRRPSAAGCSSSQRSCVLDRLCVTARAGRRGLGARRRPARGFDLRAKRRIGRSAARSRHSTFAPCSPSRSRRSSSADRVTVRSFRRAAIHSSTAFSVFLRIDDGDQTLWKHRGDHPYGTFRMLSGAGQHAKWGYQGGRLPSVVDARSGTFTCTLIPGAMPERGSRSATGRRWRRHERSPNTWCGCARTRSPPTADGPRGLMPPVRTTPSG